MKRVVVAGLLAAPVLTFGGCTAMALLVGGAGGARADECGSGGAGVAAVSTTFTDGQVSGLSGEQAGNAAVIVNAGRALGVSRRGQTIAVMTALGESGLRVLDRGDRVGPDSRGLFQQRGNGAWGSYADRMDPAVSSTNFFRAMVKVTGWEQMPPTLVANAVQRNADPGYYAQFWDDAVGVVEALAGTTARAVTADAALPAKAGASFDLGPVRPQTRALVEQVAPMFGVTTVYGFREADAHPDHPSGLAADLMVGLSADGHARGTRVATYLQAHAAGLGVAYVIWDQRIWSVKRAGQGWRPMEDRGSPTQNHKDHVHVTVSGDASSGSLPAGSGCVTDQDPAGPVVSGGWARPADGPVTSGFAMRYHPTRHVYRRHEGDDIGAPCNAPIYAARAG
ncbi:MAG TPA: hypothetical protein VES95_10860, partial [Dermatophilaceae bacterium]|nr:hypothetical protein [Dermatophilaceae bacterium]